MHDSLEAANFSCVVSISFLNCCLSTLISFPTHNGLNSFLREHPCLWRSKNTACYLLKTKWLREKKLVKSSKFEKHSKAWSFHYECSTFLIRSLSIKYKIFNKIAWIWSHHLHLQWKFILLAGKFTWGNKAKHCWVMSTNFLFSKVCWQCPAMFCLYTSSKLSRL